MAGRIILIRHGQTHNNVRHLLDTRPPGAELTEVGRRQALGVGAELADYSGERLAHMYSSIVLRAQQTAVLAAATFEKARSLEPGTVPLDVVAGIHEIDAGDYEMRGDDQAHQDYSTTLNGCLHGDPRAALPGGETYRDVLDRYQPTLEQIMDSHDLDDDRDVAIVSHSAAIRIVATHASGVDPNFAFNTYLGNGRFVVLEPGGRSFGRWTVVRWTDAPLPWLEG
ncbi:histidine phosphatase family protein [Corynebacterium pacaense]|uniref:histidine phosphatase family protein n=1 Tax=Corynebacterium pacaense TaxID=1816684 RepID=UPI0009BA5400|nr:histidine phosphatase family protein [Corynebacterium pacaense]